ncbi:hypothetical protein EDC01DRAFT_679823 [Geopyxis carbonaria]|nr:hypothetical protein EDC01DRAFT_679823 [Geopyxis carbonaria]
MDPLSFSASLIAVVSLAGQTLAATYKYRQSFKEAPTHYTMLRDEITTLTGVLTSLAHFTSSEDMNNGDILVLLEAQLQKCRNTLQDLLETLLEGVGDGKRMSMKRILWPFKEKDTLEIISVLERFKSVFTLVLSAESLSQAQGMQDKIRAVANSVEETQVQGQKLAADLKESFQITQTAHTQRWNDADFEKIIRWLTKVEFNQKHEFVSERLRQAGTTDWLFNTKEFIAWQNPLQDSSLLWLNGIPGSGKTILVSSVIDKLRALTTGNNGIAYAYCDYNETESKSTSSVLRVLLAQLLVLRPDACRSVINKLEESERRKERPPSAPDMLQKLILEVVSKGFDGVTLIIDALDECEDREPLAQSLAELSCHPQVNVFVASRDEIDLRTTLNEGDADTIELSIRAHAHEQGEDIQTYIVERIESEPRMQRYPETLKTQIITTLLEGAEGMFRWIQCQLDHIGTLRTVKDIRAALKCLPRGLYNTYERILQNIDENDVEFAIKIMNLVISAQPPLRLREIVEALAIDVESQSLDRESTVIDPIEIVEICGSLTRYDETSQELTTAHFSVQEFLVSDHLLNGELSHFHCSLASAHRMVATMCLTYCLLDDFSQTIFSIKDAVRTYHFYNYAAASLFIHVARGGDDDTVFSLVERLLLDGKHHNNLISWHHAYNHVTILDDVPELVHSDQELQKALFTIALSYCPAFAVMVDASKILGNHGLFWVVQRIMKIHPDCVEEGYALPLLYDLTLKSAFVSGVRCDCCEQGYAPPLPYDLTLQRAFSEWFLDRFGHLLLMASFIDRVRSLRWDP